MTFYKLPKLVISQRTKLISSFIILFLWYHIAEYMIMFENSALLFFTFQLLFFVSAIILGRWYSGNGLAAWGLPFSKKIGFHIIFGILLGILLYAIPYFFSILFKIESLIEIPPVSSIIRNSLPFAFGVLFTSFSEDILTRGLIFTHFKNKLNPIFLALLSASVYLLNHIYRLNDGLDTLLYIFLLGIIFIIPVLMTKNLWITGSMHWAGNVFFFIGHNIISIQENDSLFSYNYLFSICIILMIPLTWWLTRRFNAKVSILRKNSLKYSK